MKYPRSITHPKLSDYWFFRGEYSGFVYTSPNIKKNGVIMAGSAIGSTATPPVIPQPNENHK